MPNIVFLSQNKLFLASAGKSEEITSKFAQDIVDRALQIQQKNEWKSQGGGAFGSNFVWGSKGQEGQAIPVRISAATRGAADGVITYFLETDRIGGLFNYHTKEREESRLFHRESMHVSDLDRHPTSHELVCSLSQPGGIANIARMDSDGHNLSEFTEGDSLDLAPSWVPDETTKVVFQSAGVGRNNAGFPLGHGPFFIAEIDLETGAMDTLAEDDAFDLLLPKKDRKGNLYFIRRPYEPLGRPRASLLSTLKDIVFFPFRLVRAFIHFFNVFSLFFSKKPLITAGGPQRPGPDAQSMILWGRYLDAEAMLRNQKENDGALVPRSWELVCRASDGTEKVCAKSVASFDLTASDEIIYTNGSKIFHRDSEDRRNVLLSSGLIQSVSVVS